MINFQAQILRMGLALLEEMETLAEPAAGTLAPTNGYRDLI
jgi:hypothetical protein